VEAAHWLPEPELDEPELELSEPVGATLGERDRRILEFEKQWWRYAGAKERAVREEFGMSATRYYQLLNALIDLPEALVAEPMLVRRLRRLRSQRRRARAIRPPRPDVAGE
jgi:hypothetical protein